MILKELDGIMPAVGKKAFIAENAVLVGDVTMGKDCSIWYGAVLRGDVGSITLGDRVNIQDGAVLHAPNRKSVVRIGNDVSVGHNAVVHGAIIGTDGLVGMVAGALYNAVIPDGTIIAAGAVVLSGSVLEPGIYAGVPARKVKDGSSSLTARIHDNAAGDLEYKSWYEK